MPIIILGQCKRNALECQSLFLVCQEEKSAFSKVLAGRLIPTTSLASFYQTFCWVAPEMHIKKDEDKVPAMSNPDSVSAAIQPHIKRKIEQVWPMTHSYYICFYI